MPYLQKEGPVGKFTIAYLVVMCATLHFIFHFSHIYQDISNSLSLHLNLAVLSFECVRKDKHWHVESRLGE